MRTGRGLLALIGVLVLAACRAAPGTPLAAAAGRAGAEEVKALIAAGAGPDERDRHGWAPLMWAAQTGNVPALRALVAAGADPNLTDHGINGWTALMHAIHKNQNLAATFLLSVADVNVKTHDGLTALMMAAGYGNTGVVEALLAAGADPYAETSRGVTALAAAVGGVPDIDRFTVGTCQAATVKALLADSPDLNLKNNFWGRAAVWSAKFGGCSEVLSLLDRRDRERPRAVASGR